MATQQSKKKGAKKASPGISQKKIQKGKRLAHKETEDGLFPVVAIGASAGGIEAISKLLENLSPKLGMAYIVIQHLSPTHESILPELLERKNPMPVHQAQDSMHIEPDHIYVIPPNTYMSIEDSMLRLSPRIKSDGSYHSIDFFLNSLAPVYKEKAIAIILSGTASDGTVGIQSIKGEGGLTFAQNASAKFSGMPKSAADSGFIDFILSPEQIAKQLEAFPKLIYSFSDNNSNGFLKISEPELKKMFFLLHNKTGVDFSYYKPSTINRRIMRRMVLNRTTKPNEYLKLLEKNSTELDLLYKDLLINVTSFFRHEGAYAVLTKKIFPMLFKDRQPNDPLRIWIPACSSGEEAYSTAICLFEFLKDKTVITPIQIFATDLSEQAIERARSGTYPKGAMQNVSAERLSKFFIKMDGSYQVSKLLRDVCIFATHDLLKDPPFSRMDLISCQNVMIYFESNPQKKILNAFYYALKPSGYLVLGKSETIGNSAELFSQIGKNQKIYVKKSSDANPGFDFSSRTYYPALTEKYNRKIIGQQIGDASVDKEAEKLLVSRYLPASLLIDKDLQIHRFIGNTSPFLQPVSGKASLHLLKMIKEELIFDIRSLIHRSKKENRSVKKEGVIISEDGRSRELTIEVMPLKSSVSDIYWLIVFTNVKLSSPNEGALKTRAAYKKTSDDKRTAALENQLCEAREQIKIMSEEFEATREELQSSNEEVLSSNEELQSINEEIETSKEELESANEELTTINEELERRNNELKAAIDFSDAVLQTIDEPLIILSPEMRVRMANRAFYKVFKTRDDAVEGQNFFEISNYQWDIQELREKLSEMFTLDKNFQQFELQHVFNQLGERILRLNAIRIHKADSKKNALVLVLEDMTLRKKAEWQLQESEERFRLLVQNASDIITILSPEGTISYESGSVEQILGYKPTERIGKNIFQEPIVHPDDVKTKERAFKRAVATSNERVTAEFRLKHKDESYRDIEAVYVNMIEDPRISGIVANYHDVTERKNLERQREEFISIASHELRTPITSLKGYAQIMQDIFSNADDQLAGDMVKKLNVQVDRLTFLVKDLFDLTKMKQGQMVFKMEQFDIDELINEVISELQHGAKQHVLVADLEAGKTVVADKERIGQVLNNLISNALKYSPGQSKVIINSSSDKENITVGVKDFGIGIDGEVQGKVFNRFFRLHENITKNSSGLGLGLYIASEIVKGHGGKIWVESKKGSGSTFHFSLPVKSNSP